MKRKVGKNCKNVVEEFLVDQKLSEREWALKI